MLKNERNRAKLGYFYVVRSYQTTRGVLTSRTVYLGHCTYIIVWLNDCFDYYIGYFKCQPDFDFISVNVSTTKIFYLSLQSSLFSSLFFPSSFPFSFFPSSSFCTAGGQKNEPYFFNISNTVYTNTPHTIQ